MIKTLMDIFKLPSPEVMMRRELIDAKRELLAAQTAREYASAMVEYNLQRIARLESDNAYIDDAKMFGGSD